MRPKKRDHLEIARLTAALHRSGNVPAASHVRSCLAAIVRTATENGPLTRALIVRDANSAIAALDGTNA